jgi:hypothetical protein
MAEVLRLHEADFMSLVATANEEVVAGERIARRAFFDTIERGARLPTNRAEPSSASTTPRYWRLRAADVSDGGEGPVLDAVHEAFGHTDVPCWAWSRFGQL